MAQKIQAFNTGRLYQAHGQQIAYVTLSTGHVYMGDISRGIDYILAIKETPDTGPITKYDVMHAYDRNQTVKEFNRAEYEEARTWDKALGEAAVEATTSWLM